MKNTYEITYNKDSQSSWEMLIKAMEQQLKILEEEVGELSESKYIFENKLKMMNIILEKNNTEIIEEINKIGDKYPEVKDNLSHLIINMLNEIKDIITMEEEENNS